MKCFMQMAVWVSGVMLATSFSAVADDVPATFTTEIKDIQFNRDIRPILSDKCFQCHGQDRNKREGDLRLDVEEDAKLDRKGEFVVNPGKPHLSELVERIFASDADDAMPPKDSGKSLTDAQRHLLAVWIEQGAEYEPHWAYIPPKQHTISANATAEWGSNPIDYFIKERLDEVGLTPSPKADPVTLVRRVYHDITGLPPTPEVVDAYAAHPTQEALDKLVSDLIATPQYGERMAINWLDQVRYADSNGYHSDEERSIYPYRDYVIKSFNTNKPFDEFTVEQLAGDLLDHPTQEQLVATGFNRLNQITAEGGAQSKEYRAKYNADRVRALGSVWMGATLGCVECHAHKFDPYELHDFYRFAAFFADIEEEDVYGGNSGWPPVLRLANDEQAKQLAGMDAEIEFLKQAILDINTETQQRADTWIESLKNGADTITQGWLPLVPEAATTDLGGVFEVQPDVSILSVGLDAPQDVHTFTFRTNLPEVTSLRFDAFDHPSFRKSLSRYRRHVQLNECEIFVKTPAMSEAQPVKIVDGYFSFDFNKGALRSTFDGDPKSKWTRGTDKRAISWMYLFDTPIPAGENTEITVRMHYLGIAGGDRSAFGRLRVSATSDAQPNITAPIGIPEGIAQAIAAKRPLTESEATIASRYFTSSDPARETSRAALAKRYQEKLALKNGLPYTLYTKTIPIPRETRFLPRGDWQDDSGPIMEPGVPAFLPPLKNIQGRPTRLDLAQWLVDQDNPLTARVFMNRLWKLYFGIGLSGQLNDIGLQGESPSHPKLLDWLSIEFVNSGWDIKHMVHLITTSAVYQQSSAVSDELLERDPKNRLMARQSAFRYEAEMVWDAALSMGGILNDSIGGPSARPYQPVGYWENLNFPKRTYKPDENEQQYRRGLYVHWQRSFLHPSLMAFDAPSREECVAERTMSNTPLQALTLLNDPTYLEAARAFAARIVSEGGVTPEEKITWAMRHGVLRVPTVDEMTLLSGLYAKHHATYTQDAEAANKVLAIGMKSVPKNTDHAELAAWTSIARIILNLHETITRS